MARGGFSLRSLMGAVVGGVAGFASKEIGKTLAGILNLGDVDDLKATIIGVVAALIALPMVGGILFGRLSKSWTSFGVIIGAVVRAVMDNGLIPINQSNQTNTQTS